MARRKPPEADPFLEKLKAKPAPEPTAAKSRVTAAKKAAKEKRKPPGEEAGLDTQSLTVTTWEKKRIFYNNPGIEACMRQLIDLPEPESTIHGIMGGDYHGFDFIPTLQRIANSPLTDLRVATLGFNQKNNLQLCRMIDEGKIAGPVTMVASMYFAQNDPQVFSKAKAELEQRGSTLANTRNHAKIIACLIDREDGAQDAIVVETSANLRSCNSLEHFTIANSRPLYDFHKAWIDDVASNTTT